MGRPLSPEARKAVSRGRKELFRRDPGARERLGAAKRKEALARLAADDDEVITHKACSKCGELKPLSEFSTRKTKLRCGLIRCRPEASCRTCVSERCKEWRRRKEAEGHDPRAKDRERYRNLTPEQKQRRQERNRENSAARRRQEGIPPRNLKKRRRHEVPVEPTAVLLEALMALGFTKKEIALRSGVDERELYRMETLEAAMVSIDHVDKILIAFDRQDDLNELYPPPPEREVLIGYGVLDPDGILPSSGRG
jgi:hypothetical protein